MLSLLVLFLAVSATHSQQCSCTFELFSQYNCEGKTKNYTYKASAGVCQDGAVFSKDCRLTVYNESTSCDAGPNFPLPTSGCSESANPSSPVKSFKTIKCGSGPAPPPPPAASGCKCEISQYNVSNCQGTPVGKPFPIDGPVQKCLGHGAEFGPKCSLKIFNESDCSGQINAILPYDGCFDIKTSLGFNQSVYSKCVPSGAPPPPPAPKVCNCTIGVYTQLNCTGKPLQTIPIKGKADTCAGNFKFDDNCNPTLYAGRQCYLPIGQLGPVGCLNLGPQFKNPQGIVAISSSNCGVVSEKHVDQLLHGRAPWNEDAFADAIFSEFGL